jgi:hypothetical protein
MRGGGPWLVAAVAAVVLGSGWGIRLAVTADPARRVRAREAVAAVAQYGLLFGFAAVAAAVSAHGLVGFARANMGLPGLWPYLLWGSLDGAAGLCAVLLMRRAARGESALAPRLAVWGLVAASSVFNWTHAPDHPGAREAFALMPVIAAMLFEFSLRETRHTARGAERTLTGPGWLHPVERLRVRTQLSADAKLSAAAATRRVRVTYAARRLYALRQVLDVVERAATLGVIAARRVRRAERRAHAALARARFTDPVVAAEILRQVQVLTLTRTLAQLDYTTADHAQAVLASMIGSAPDAPATANGLTGQALPAWWSSFMPGNGALNGHGASPGTCGRPAAPAAWAASDGHGGGVSPGNGQSSLPVACLVPRPPRASESRDSPLIDRAVRIVAQARLQGGPLSQAALARQLRAEGYSIANDRLRWLATVSGLEPPTGQMQ